MPRFNRILVPYDGSEASTRALEAAVQLAREARGRVRLLHVLDQLEYVAGSQYGGASFFEDLKAEGRNVLDRGGAICEAAGVPLEARLLEDPGGRLGEKVAAEASAWQADLVVVGTHGRRGVSRALLGSGAEQIIRFTSAPVLVVREMAARD